MRIILLGLSILLFFTQPVSGQKDRIDRIVRAKDLAGAQLGIDIRDENGRSLYSSGGNSLLIPGSTLKLITSLSLLDELGSDYHFETKLVLSGTLHPDGSLYGDLLVLGSGDPSLGSDDDPGAEGLESILSAFSTAVKKAGIRCVSGELICHSSGFEARAIHDSWAWDDLTNYYASGAYGINVHENYFQIYFQRPNQADEPTQVVHISPEIQGLRIKNYVRTGEKGSGDNAYVYGDPYSYNREVYGTIPAGDGMFAIKAAIPDPGLFFVSDLRERLAEMGIGIDGGIKKLSHYRAEKIKELHVHKSEALSELVSYANRVSNNLYCEAFLRILGKHRYGYGSFENGIKAITGMQDSLFEGGISMTMVDGSGLSWRNRISPEALNKHLVHYYRKFGSSRIKSYLPRAGHEGSVSGFLKNPAKARKAWFKSGSINGVLCYSGFVENPNGHPLFISLMSNAHSCGNNKLRKYYEEIIESAMEL